ncbi:MAG: hypothetical protein IH831_09165 [Planctomycetes bacterium]|nr:hypothetical protein [Planctomycetota bacterium]
MQFGEHGVASGTQEQDKATTARYRTYVHYLQIARVSRQIAGNGVPELLANAYETRVCGEMPAGYFVGIVEAIRGRNWSGFRYPDHVDYFTPHTLATLE